MNQKGDLEETFFTYGWALFVIVIVIAALYSFGVFEPIEEAPVFVEEWVCSEEVETGNLIDCEAEKKTEIITLEEESHTCRVLGEDWWAVDRICYEEDKGQIYCYSVCERNYEEILCDKKVECIEWVWTKTKVESLKD